MYYTNFSFKLFFLFLSLFHLTAHAQNNHIPILSCQNQIGGDELFISELYDAVSGVPGAIEIYNPTNQSIVLNNVYAIERATDPGAVPSVNYPLTETIAANSTYLLTIQLTACTVVSDFPMTAGINANDEIILKKNGIAIDEARGGVQNGYTIIRKPDAITPSATYNASDWIISNTPLCGNLQQHTITLQSSQERILKTSSDVSICQGNDAIIYVEASNPTSASYQWKKRIDNNQWIDVEDVNGVSGANAFQLNFNDADIFISGAYYLEINYGSCQLISPIINVVIHPEPNVLIDVIQPVCGEVFGKINFISQDSQNYQFRINDGAFQNQNAIDNLSPGDYNVEVKNENGCSFTQTIVIQSSPIVPPTPVVEVIQPTCQSLVGTIIILQPEHSGFLYSIDGINYTMDTVFQNLDSGNYFVRVKAPSGCIAETQVTIQHFEADDNLDFYVEHGCVVSSFNDSRQYIVTLKIPENVSQNDVQIKWKDNLGYVFLENTNSFNVREYLRDRNISFISPLEFTVEVTTPKGCLLEKTIIVEGIVCDIPKGISPNGDGLNDFFDLTGYNVTSLTIFNRYGKKVNQYGNYANQWRGQDFNGNILPTGTYYYEIIKMDGSIVTGYVQLVTE